MKSRARKKNFYKYFTFTYYQERLQHFLYYYSKTFHECGVICIVEVVQNRKAQTLAFCLGE
jgi:hypothetical protein